MLSSFTHYVRNIFWYKMLQIQDTYPVENTDSRYLFVNVRKKTYYCFCKIFICAFTSCKFKYKPLPWLHSKKQSHYNLLQPHVCYHKIKISKVVGLINPTRILIMLQSYQYFNSFRKNILIMIFLFVIFQLSMRIQIVHQTVIQPNVSSQTVSAQLTEPEFQEIQNQAMYLK